MCFLSKLELGFETCCVHLAPGVTQDGNLTTYEVWGLLARYFAQWNTHIRATYGQILVDVSFMAEQFRGITQTAWYTLCSWMTAGINSCGTFISLQVWWLLTFCFAQQKYYVRSTYAQSLVDGSLMAAELEGVLVQQHCTFKHNAHIYKAIDIKGLGKLYLLKNDCFWPVILYKQRPI